jgi:hypothetical protein
MNITVLTAEALDLGVGPQKTTAFVDSAWHVDDAGALHIKRESARGNYVSFAPHAWVAVLENSVVVTALGGAR